MAIFYLYKNFDHLIPDATEVWAVVIVGSGGGCGGSGDDEILLDIFLILFPFLSIILSPFLTSSSTPF